MAKSAVTVAAGLCCLVSSQVFAAGLSPSQEIKLLTQMSKNGNHDAQLQLALAYQEGRYGLKADADTGIYWLTQAAQGGQYYAADRLANAYAHGQGVKQDMPTAVHWWKVAAAGGNADAEARLGEQLEASNQTDARHWLEKSADQGDARAETDLRKLYSENEAPAADLQRGKHELDTISAQLGLPAMKFVAAVWDTISISMSADETATRLEKDAKAGDPVAEYQLALHYRDGAWGVNRDIHKALYWLRQAAHNGNPVAMKTLSEVYRKGDLGVAPDKVRADKWESRARGNQPSTRIQGS